MKRKGVFEYLFIFLINEQQRPTPWNVAIRGIRILNSRKNHLRGYDKAVVAYVAYVVI